MHMYIRMLGKVSSRYAPSRNLSFQEVHVFKTLQLLHEKGQVSRDLLCEELSLGEGAIKTLVKHLKMHDLIKTSNGGTRLTEKGKAIASSLISSIPAEISIPRCSVGLGEFNYVVLLKDLGYAIKSGIEQRDAAIKIGAVGATTMLFKDGKFVMPSDRNFDSLKKEPNIRKSLLDTLDPQEGDVLIIGSSNNKITAELGAKNAAILTLMLHEKHA